MNRVACFAGCLAIAAFCAADDVSKLNDLVNARDAQDLNRLDAIIKQLEPANTPDRQYRLALAYSYAAEVAMELRDKHRSENLAQTGLDSAKKAEAANGNNAQYHMLVGQLCGQVIPANPIMGTLKYGQCARDEIDKAIQLDPKLAEAYVTRGVGNYYLPQQMGGGPELAIKDFDTAISLDANLADAYLWKGIALRKMNKNAEAREAFQRALQLDPNRVWTREQLAKTPTR